MQVKTLASCLSNYAVKKKMAKFMNYVPNLFNDDSLSKSSKRTTIALRDLKNILNEACIRGAQKLAFLPEEEYRIILILLKLDLAMNVLKIKNEDIYDDFIEEHHKISLAWVPKNQIHSVFEHLQFSAKAFVISEDALFFVDLFSNRTETIPCSAQALNNIKSSFSIDTRLPPKCVIDRLNEEQLQYVKAQSRHQLKNLTGDFMDDAVRMTFPCPETLAFFDPQELIDDFGKETFQRLALLYRKGEFTKLAYDIEKSRRPTNSKSRLTNL